MPASTRWASRIDAHRAAVAQTGLLSVWLTAVPEITLQHAATCRRCGAPLAVGVCASPQFTYISYDDHRIVLDQLVGRGTRRTTDRVAVPTTTFLTPPLSRVGLTETQARAQGLAVHVVAKQVADIAAMPRPKIVGETHGLIKLVVDADTELLVVATLFCVDSQELINLVALAIRAGVRAADLRDGIWTHPSSTQALNEVLAALPAPGA
ncbi:hypothetical protein DDP54_00725 (plasmid) [Cellulomonas sp. WB94]|nr:hypothetical protein DDP54_00725 [Cellulomonas sp. WB94]